MPRVNRNQGVTGVALAFAAMCTMIAACGSQNQNSTVMPNSPVSNGGVTSLALTANTAGLSPGSSVQVTATATFADGTRSDVTTTTGILWGSTNVNVFTVGPNGGLLANGTGTADVTATFGTASAKLTVTVTAQLPNAPVIVQNTDRYICARQDKDTSKLGNFRITGFNGTTISEVDVLFTSKDSAGQYTAQLTVLVGGAASGQSVSIPVSLPALDTGLLGAFAFAPAITVPKGSTVAFQMKQTSGFVDGKGDPGLHYEGTALSDSINGGACPVTFDIGHPFVHIVGAP